MTTGTKVTIEQAKAVEARLRYGSKTIDLIVGAADTIAALIKELEVAQRGLDVYKSQYNEVYDQLEAAQNDAARAALGEKT